MYKLKKKKEELNLNKNKSYILYESIISENTSVYIDNFIETLDEYIIFDFSNKYNGSENKINFDKSLSKKEILNKINKGLKQNKGKYLIIYNIPLELLDFFKINKFKFLVFVHQFPNDNTLLRLGNPFLITGRNFANEEQSLEHNAVYYLYKFRLLQFFDILFLTSIAFLLLYVTYVGIPTNETSSISDNNQTLFNFVMNKLS